MATCGLCGGFSFGGTTGGDGSLGLCSLCANTLSGSGQTLTMEDGTTVRIGNIFTMAPGKARDDLWKQIGDAHAASVKERKSGLTFVLAGELARVTYKKEEKSFFQTVLYATDGSLETIWAGRAAYHRTKPRQNFTVVYTRDSEGNITIIGTGNHVGGDNDKYSITFDTGRVSTCER
jgi:hypothetical protein